MSRILGIDYGTKRIGLSISDESHKLAFPYETIDRDDIIKRLREICKKESIEKIIIGNPRGLREMQDTNMTKIVHEFVTSLGALGVSLQLVDEFYSTKEAGNLPTRKENIDQSAATIILQSYLDSDTIGT
jgi:putative holliday junction resolvase